MSFYGTCIVPHLVHLAMRNKRLLPYRERTISAADGRVLEIGIGSGLNLPFYSGGVSEVIGLEPASRLLSMAGKQSRRVPVALVEGSAEAIPIESGSIDTVVTTWTLCTIPAVAQALAEMRRVLKPGGQLLFVEHGLAPDAGVRKWQDWLTPAWKRIGGGCHLNRPIRSLIEQNGFRLTRLETGYMPGPKPMAFLYQGSAGPG
ncbi:class I SAM-dependent methyltransferase [Dongia deserti]|uniref:class I SAM-dependent methyltransferase n=1 Tax=Dongia deserti TaxID=2268030 RepID=UPI0025485FF0|nr:class I SAM-dependent methyltransferase [Dongia deserti]